MSRPASSEDLASQPAWASLPDVLERMCNDYLRASFARVSPPQRPAQAPLGAVIPMADVGNQLEVHIAVVTDRDAARAFAAHLFGDPDLVDEATARDIVLELANWAMGEAKTALSQGAFAFTAGIPEARELAHVEPFLLPFHVRHELAFQADGALVVFGVGVRSHWGVRLPAQSLRESMVLAQDVRTRAGELLEANGARLTKTMAVRIAEEWGEEPVAVVDPLV